MRVEPACHITTIIAKVYEQCTSTLVAASLQHFTQTYSALLCAMFWLTDDVHSSRSEQGPADNILCTVRLLPVATGMCHGVWCLYGGHTPLSCTNNRFARAQSHQLRRLLSAPPCNLLLFPLRTA